MGARADCDALVGQVRSADIAAGLIAFGAFVTGRPCVLAQGDLTLRPHGDTVNPVTDSAGNPLSVAEILPPDVALDGLGLELVRLHRGRAIRPDRRAQIGGLLWRAGLLLRMLDTAYAHLLPRQSNGQKTLQHQLVKATFTECHAVAERIRMEAPHGLDSAVAADLQSLQDMLTAATTRAAKLMGGHGYLRGSLNALECLSLCFAALAAGNARGSARAAA